MINVFPCISDNGDHGKKDRLYRAIIVVLRSFVSEKNGVYTWDRNNEILFQDMCKKMPKRYLKQLFRFLEKESENLMVSQLDEMIRFSIYLEDKQRWDICEGMMNVIRQRL